MIRIFLFYLFTQLSLFAQEGKEEVLLKVLSAYENVLYVANASIKDGSIIEGYALFKKVTRNPSDSIIMRALVSTTKKHVFHSYIVGYGPKWNSIIYYIESDIILHNGENINIQDVLKKIKFKKKLIGVVKAKNAELYLKEIEEIKQQRQRSKELKKIQQQQ